MERYFVWDETAAILRDEIAIFSARMNGGMKEEKGKEKREK